MFAFVQRRVFVCVVRTMSKGIKGHQDRELQAKMRERDRDKKLREYHDGILTVADDAATGVTLPPIQDDTVRVCSLPFRISGQTIARGFVIGVFVVEF